MWFNFFTLTLQTVFRICKGVFKLLCQLTPRIPMPPFNDGFYTSTSLLANLFTATWKKTVHDDLILLEAISAACNNNSISGSTINNSNTSIICAIVYSTTLAMPDVLSVVLVLLMFWGTARCTVCTDLLSKVLMTDVLPDVLYVMPDADISGYKQLYFNSYAIQLSRVSWVILLSSSECTQVLIPISQVTSSFTILVHCKVSKR